MSFIQRNMAASTVTAVALSVAAIAYCIFGKALLGPGRNSLQKQKLDEELDDVLEQSMDASDATAKY